MTDFPKILKVYTLGRKPVRTEVNVLGRMVGIALMIGVGFVAVGSMIKLVTPSAVEHQSK
jgi:hypothetical protein